jgi:hypothetical protein
VRSHFQQDKGAIETKLRAIAIDKRYINLERSHFQEDKGAIETENKSNLLMTIHTQQ